MQPDFNIQDKTLWTVVGLLALGVIARQLLDTANEVTLRRFIGEMSLSLLVAVFLYAAGVLQGMSPLQIVLLGTLGAIGSVRVLVWALKLISAIKSM